MKNVSSWIWRFHFSWYVVIHLFFHTMDLHVETYQSAWTHWIWFCCTDTSNSELGGAGGRQRHRSEPCADNVLKETIRQVLQVHPEGVRLQDLAAVFQVPPSRCQSSEFLSRVLQIIGIRNILHVYIVSLSVVFMNMFVYSLEGQS